MCRCVCWWVLQTFVLLLHFFFILSFAQCCCVFFLSISYAVRKAWAVFIPFVYFRNTRNNNSNKKLVHNRARIVSGRRSHYNDLWRKATKATTKKEEKIPRGYLWMSSMNAKGKWCVYVYLSVTSIVSIWFRRKSTRVPKNEVLRKKSHMHTRKITQYDYVPRISYCFAACICALNRANSQTYIIVRWLETS